MTQSRFPPKLRVPPSRALAWRQGYAALRSGTEQITAVNPASLVMELPQFPLEVRLRGTDGTAAVALCATATDTISHSSPAAARRGVRPGMGFRRASALCPELQCLSRDPAAEHAMQLQIQQWFLLSGLDVEFSSAGPAEPVTLRVSAPAGLNEEAVLTRVRRDLRRLGFRACSQTRRSLRSARARGPTPAAVHSTEPLQRGLSLPWAIQRPAAINIAVERLLDDLRFELEVSARSARWVQICCVGPRGERIHHRFEVENAPDPLALVARELRRWLHTGGVPPIVALELRAGAAPGASASGSFIGYSSLGIQ